MRAGFRTVFSCRKRAVTAMLPLLAAVAAVAAVAAPAGASWAAVTPHSASRISKTVDASKLSTTAAARKGVCVSPFRRVDEALATSRASWYLTWSTSHYGIATPRWGQFVPMIWGAQDETPTALAQAKRAGPVLLTFNEPDRSDQANMSVSEALSLWPKLMATGLLLASPAVADEAAAPGGWLDEFMRGATKRHFRVNFIAVHWYGADFRTAAAVNQLEAYLEAVYHRYHRPIWLTEYSLIAFASSGPVYATAAEQSDFVSSSIAMLDRLSFVDRYAWYALSASSSGPGTGLYAPSGAPTPAGIAFQRA